LRPLLQQLHGRLQAVPCCFQKRFVPLCPFRELSIRVPSEIGFLLRQPIGKPGLAIDQLFKPFEITV
jgi:hypothetical protein